MQHITLCTPMHYIYVGISHLHIYDRSHGAMTRGTARASTNRGRQHPARQRQVLVHLTKIFEFTLPIYILIMILGCALGYRS
jgi:hypothetical protein